MKATKTDVIDCVSEHSQLSKAQLKHTFNLFLHHIQSLLGECGTIELRGFGTFGTREYPARENARNPKTGEPVSVRKRSVPFFRPGKKMRQIVDQAAQNTPKKR